MGGLHKSKEKQNPIYYHLVPKKNPLGYTEYIIYCILFAIRYGVTIIDWIENMKYYVSYIVESYKDSIIGNLVNSVKADLLLHIV